MKYLFSNFIRVFLVSAPSILVTSLINAETREFRSLKQMHLYACPLNDICEERFNIDIEGYGEDLIPCCGQCSCDSDCYKLGTCCLGMYTSLEHGKEIVSNSRYECKKRQYLSSDDIEFNKEEKYWMVTKCAEDAVDDSNKNLCENPGIDGNVESIVPVTDLDQVVHYRNIFCAFCNGRYDTRDFEVWKLELHCHDIISINDAHLLAKIEEKKCNIIYDMAPNTNFHKCDYWPPYTISKCNQTGQWPSYDPIIDSACEAFQDPFNLTYKNYFCYLCNTDTQPILELWNCQKVLGEIHDVTPAFFAILDVDALRKITDDVPDLKCEPKVQFEDFKTKKCRDILCGERNYLDTSTATCLLKTHIAEHICYRTFFKLTPVKNMSKSLLKSMQDRSYHLFDNTIYGLKDVINEIQLFHQLEEEDLSKVDFILLYMVVDLSMATGNYQVQIVDILTLHNRTLPVDLAEDVIEFYMEIGSYNATFRNSNAEIYVTSKDDIKAVTIMNVTLTRGIDPDSCYGKQSVDINRLLICPFVEIEFEEIFMSVENGFLIVQGNSAFNKTYLSWEFRVTETGVLLCLEDYTPIYNALPKFTSQSKVSAEEDVGPKRILSFVCVCMSITCLLVTIVTYLIFSELQSQPGINNLTLCICLLLAQTIYQFGAGQQSLSGSACSVIGALCHLFWLSVLFSMNACSVQMFMIFRSNMKLSPVFNKRSTFVTILYISFASLTFVLINTAVSFVSSKGENIGYGGTICFIRSYQMHIITFIVPSLVLITINLVLFMYVVNKMRKFNIISSKLHQERNYLRINARLSTLTGLTWLFGFLQLLIRQDFIEYLFIIFNACQGLFIMIAFVCNHRVYSLIFRRRSRRESKTENTLDQK